MARRELHLLDSPIPILQRIALGCLPGGFHGLINVIAEDRAIDFGAVVVLTGGDVAGAAGEVHLEDIAIFLLAFSPRQPTKIAADAPVAVITHRMSGVMTQRGLRLGAMPKTHGL